MNRLPRWMLVGFMTAGLLALVLVAGRALAQGPGGSEPMAPAGGSLADTMTYQGYLEWNGAPANGVFDFRVSVWTAASGGSQVGSTQIFDSPGVTVQEGFFTINTAPGDPNTVYTGAERWLQLEVRPHGVGSYTTLPRQPITNVPYAWGLRPGAVVSGSATGSEDALLNIFNDSLWYPAFYVRSATASAVSAYSPAGIAVVGSTDDGYAVAGWDYGSTTSKGYGGFFSSENGVGVFGRSNAVRHWNNMYAPGVYGLSANGAGVYGVSQCSGGSCYGGVFNGAVGMSARGSGSSSSGGYGGVFVSENHRGIYAQSLSGWYDGYFPGTGGIYSAGGYASKAGQRTIAFNGDDVALRPGDVVALAGVVESPDGSGPMLSVQRADAAHSAAVIGVMVQAVRAEMREMAELGGVAILDVQPVEGDAPPGGYLAIATEGLVPAVRVDLARGDLEIGDWLTVAAIPGVARRADPAGADEGAILGKVAGPVDPQTGTVPVFIILR